VPHPAAARRFLALLSIALAFAACGGDTGPSGSPPRASGHSVGGSSAGTGSTLAGTSWIVVSVNGRSPVPGAVPTFRFDADRVSGSGGCNQFGGSYRADPSTGQFAARELVSTDMGCVQAGVSAFESTFLQALGGTSQAVLDPAGQLILSGPAGGIVLVALEHPAVGG
jgi:heat shock protein HslJ